MSQLTILIVEDTALLRRIYSEKLSESGYVTLTAADGAEALQHLHSAEVDLVLLDLIMPRMSGLEALETMKKDPRTRDIPVLILSNLGQESDIERGLSLGAVDYLIKNEAKPADVVDKIALTLEHMAGLSAPVPSYRVAIKDRTLDADRLVEHANLMRRFWCPSCEVEIALELLPVSDRPGWFDAHLVCPMCDREFD